MTDEQTAQEREFLDEWERKRRRRRRTVLLTVLGALLLVIVLPLLAGFIYDRYWQGRLNAKVAALTAQGKLLTWQQMQARDKDMPADKNSALVYLRAFDQMGEDTSRTDLLQAIVHSEEPGVRPSRRTLDLLAAEARANADALKTMRSAAPLQEGCYPLGPGPSPETVDQPYLTQAYHAAQFCMRVAVLHAAQGEPALATPCLEAGLGLASSLGGKTFLIGGLVRIAVDAATRKGLESALALCRFTPEELQAFQARVERERQALSLADCFIFERSTAHFIFGHILRDRESMAAFGRDTNAGPEFRFYGWIPGWRERDELFYYSVIDEVERIRALPPRQALPQMKAFADSLGAKMRNASPPPVLSAALIPAIKRSLEEEVLCKVNLATAAAPMLRADSMVSLRRPRAAGPTAAARPRTASRPPRRPRPGPRRGIGKPRRAKSSMASLALASASPAAWPGVGSRLLSITSGSAARSRSPLDGVRRSRWSPVAERCQGRHVHRQ